MTDWSTIIPDEPAPPHNKNFADHFWEERTEGRVCRNCSLRGRMSWAKAAEPATALTTNAQQRKWKPNAIGCGPPSSMPHQQERND